MSQFSDYATHVRGLDPSAILGQLVWFTVPDSLEVPHDFIDKALTAANLGGSTPKPPADADVFRRKCSAAQRKRVPTADAEVYHNYLVRDPGSNGIIKRHLVRETVNAKNQRLGYDTVAELAFERSTSGVSFTIMVDVDAPDHGTIVEICKEVVAAYQIGKGCLSGYSIRELIRKVLVNNNATNVRYPTGGVYFLSTDHADAVAGIEEVADTLDGVHVHSLPLLDDGKQREMLKRAFEAESIDRANALVTEIAALMAAGKPIGKERHASYVNALNDLRAKCGEYTGLLQTSLSTTRSSLSILERQIVALLGKVS